MSRTLIVVSALTILALGVAFAEYVLPGSGGGNETRLEGSLFVSDAGRSHGGFEYTASYNITLNARDGSGTMTAVLDVGLGDVLTKHEYSVANFRMTAGEVRMTLEGRPVVLAFTSNDSVWNHTYDNFYIGSWGPEAPAGEIRGSISPLVFAGVPSSYYVELRMA